MKLFSAFFLATAASDEESRVVIGGDCLSVITELQELNPIKNGFWNCKKRVGFPPSNAGFDDAEAKRWVCNGYCNNDEDDFVGGERPIINANCLSQEFMPPR
ncbi:Oidioi.mRNA.OKI2018_I69.PAR.g10255.t1.cds [Oikopleura dioica]|uniref:Oidioi.mRNA.OKI2018_I69.PAR.g10255.t1.cds n=1 Tax=Oikopleura dioica TaxID=34765 RepID=A0ABN7RPR7_OIKDI|nr:Oidioi.mRNA.OKI2018_I69.PAR.g10255.t1.cds [Oikopleura dioica]